MSQIRYVCPVLAILMVLSVLLLGGCGSGNSPSTFNPDTGLHSVGWLPTGHKTEAIARLESCAPCHGADYGGGISKVACTDCHLGNQQSVHPAQWGPFADLLHANYVRENGATSCATAVCHGSALNGVGGTGPSCTLCHLGGVYAVHPTAWGSYTYALHASFAAINGTSSCTNASCHGPTLAGVGGSGPSCTLCHIGGVNLKHPAAWTANITLHKDYVAANGDTSCRNVVCHGASLEGILLSGPACQVCH